jgi:hypothetical protein
MSCGNNISYKSAFLEKVGSKYQINKRTLSKFQEDKIIYPASMAKILIILAVMKEIDSVFMLQKKMKTAAVSFLNPSRIQLKGEELIRKSRFEIPINLWSEFSDLKISDINPDQLADCMKRNGFGWSKKGLASPICLDLGNQTLEEVMKDTIYKSSNYGPGELQRLLRFFTREKEWDESYGMQRTEENIAEFGFNKDTFYIGAAYRNGSHSKYRAHNMSQSAISKAVFDFYLKLVNRELPFSEQIEEIMTTSSNRGKFYGQLLNRDFEQTEIARKSGTWSVFNADSVLLRPNNNKIPKFISVYLSSNCQQSANFNYRKLVDESFKKLDNYQDLFNKQILNNTFNASQLSEKDFINIRKNSWSELTKNIFLNASDKGQMHTGANEVISNNFQKILGLTKKFPAICSVRVAGNKLPLGTKSTEQSSSSEYKVLIPQDCIKELKSTQSIPCNSSEFSDYNENNLWVDIHEGCKL